MRGAKVDIVMFAPGHPLQNGLHRSIEGNRVNADAKDVDSRKAHAKTGNVPRSTATLGHPKGKIIRGLRALCNTRPSEIGLSFYLPAHTHFDSQGWVEQ